MDRLSPEILTLIVDDVHKKVRASHEPRGLSRLAAISRLWQLIVEERLFESIIIADTEVESFAKVFGGRFKVRLQWTELHSRNEVCSHLHLFR